MKFNGIEVSSIRILRFVIDLTLSGRPKTLANIVRSRQVLMLTARGFAEDMTTTVSIAS